MSTDTTQTVAANVRAEVARRRVRQADLAAALGISQQAMSRRLSGEGRFDVDEIRKVADFFGVDVASFFVEVVEVSA